MGLYRRSGSKKWWISYTDLSGRQHRESSGSLNRRQAERLLAMRRGEAVEARLGLPRSKSPRIGDWAKEYLDGVAHLNTRNRYSASIAHLVSFFGNSRLSDITPESIYRFQRARLAAGVRNATINRDVSALSAMLRKAKKFRYVSSNPCQDVDPLDELRERRQAKPFTFGEEARLMAAAEPLLRTLVTVVIEAGLRPRIEALPLMWADVHLNETLPYLVVRASKTPAGVRSVLLTSRCAQQLREWKKFLGDSNSEFVFPAPRSPKRHWKVYQDSWERATKVAGLEGRRVYDLRSTFASRAHSVYPNNLTISRMLGHSTPAILPTYVKAFDENTIAVIAGLDFLRNQQGTMPGLQ